MTAGVLTRPSDPPVGLRQIDARRDMGKVADLIEIAFGGNLDPTGRRMLREMRVLGRMGWLGWLASMLLLPPAARPMGYIWMEDERLVGNASLLPVKGHMHRWLMANVAVHPDYRRRGIAHEMTRACLGLARRGGAESVVLQVDRENQAAQVLYASMGFRPLGTRASWRRASRSAFQAAGQIPDIRPRRKGEWRDQWELAMANFPEGVVWPYPTASELFRSGRNTRHWLYWSGQQLVGSLSVREGIIQRMMLVVHRELRGQIEGDLLRHALSRMRADRAALLLDYPVDAIPETLKSLGFRQDRALTWMRKELSASDKSVGAG